MKKLLTLTMVPLAALSLMATAHADVVVRPEGVVLVFGSLFWPYLLVAAVIVVTALLLKKFKKKK